MHPTRSNGKICYIEVPPTILRARPIFYKINDSIPLNCGYAEGTTPSTNMSRRSSAFPRSFSASAYELDPYHSCARCIERNSTMTILRPVGGPSTTCTLAPRAR